MSQQNSSLSPELLAALEDLVRREIPKGQTVTFDSAETAVVQLLRKLGPDLLAATLESEAAKSSTSEAGKRGHRRSVPADK